MAINTVPTNLADIQPQSDPTIRQEFPGADTAKKKIEAGKRNIKSDQDDKPLPVEEDVPKSDAEPLDSSSSPIK